MSTKDNGGPAFPREDYQANGNNGKLGQEGMSLRAYAAVSLRVPDSGTPWLDDMIRQSLRDEFAAKAMQGLVAAGPAHLIGSNKKLVPFSYEIADAMLKKSQS